jgi:hypothetical protein
MLIAAILVGALTAYYFGLRPGMYAAIATFVLGAVALFVPRLAWPVHLAMAAGAIAIWQIGSRRPRPNDAVLATRFVRRAAGRAWARLFRAGDDDR